MAVVVPASATLFDGARASLLQPGREWDCDRLCIRRIGIASNLAAFLFRRAVTGRFAAALQKAQVCSDEVVSEPTSHTRALMYGKGGGGGAGGDSVAWAGAVGCVLIRRDDDGRVGCAVIRGDARDARWFGSGSRRQR